MICLWCCWPIPKNSTANRSLSKALSAACKSASAKCFASAPHAGSARSEGTCCWIYSGAPCCVLPTHPTGNRAPDAHAKIGYVQEIYKSEPYRRAWV
jgi:hypothetical protein